MTVLVIAEHNNTIIKSSTFNTITAALQIDNDVHILVCGHNVKAVANIATKIAGINRVLLADTLQLAHHLAENVVSQILNIAYNYTHILAPATAYGKNILPRLAAKLDVAQISEIIKVHSPDIFERQIYAGNAIAIVQSYDFIKLITVRHTSFNRAINGGHAVLQLIPTILSDKSISNFISHQITKSHRPELTTAKIIVSGGRGIGSADNFKMLELLADKLNAAIGASRAAVDAGFAPNDWQIGQTGKIVAPQLYIAVGISGAIQHLAGMKDSKVIVAINKDKEAPIFAIADYGIVSDWFEVVPKLIEQLS